MTKLSVNVNKVALLRNSRAGEVPDPVAISRLALEAGAAGITVHPRPDERHIRRDDVDHLADLLREPTYHDREFNIEGNPFLGDYMAIVRAVKPTQCTLVPDTPEQKTSDHGWRFPDDLARLTPVVEELQALGCRVSLFMDPEPAQIAKATTSGADRVELYTEGYAAAYAQGGKQAERMFERYAAAAARAQQVGLEVNGGHDLNLANLARFVSIPGIMEVSIGHALIADALTLGIAATIKAYLGEIAKGAN